MIAIDTSAIAAIALDEREARQFGEIVGAEECVIGWPTVFEAFLVLSPISRRRGLDVLDKVLAAPHLNIVAFDGRTYQSACAAFERYGRGRHPAQLNFGDCMSYAVAEVHQAALLYKGDDFPRTDIAAAFP